MPYSKQTYTASAGVNGPFAISFPAILPAHIKAKIDGVVEADFTLNAGASELTFGGTVVFAGGEEVEIYRETPKTALVDFVNGGPLLEQDLDKAVLQSLYLIQENLDVDAEVSALLDATIVVLDAHIAAATPHSGHENKSEKGAANGYAGLDGGGLVDPDDLGTGAAGLGAKVLYDDQTWAEPPGATGGEANTIAGSGAGETLLQTPSKVGTELRIKDLIAGTNITLTPTATGIEIDATGGVGGGTVEDIVAPAVSGLSIIHATSLSGTDLQLRKLVEGPGVNLTHVGDDRLQIDGTGISAERPLSMERSEAAVWKKAGVFSLAHFGLVEPPQIDTVNYTSLDDASGPRLKMSTNTTPFGTGSPAAKAGGCGLRFRPVHLQRRWNPNIGFERVQIAQGDLNTCRAYIGCSSADYVYGLSSLAATHMAAFRFDSTVHASLLYAVCSDGAGGVTATQLPGTSPMTEHDYIIEMDTGEVRFYIDGNLQTTINTTLPGSSTYLGPCIAISLIGAGAVQRHIAFSRVGWNHE